MQTDASGVLTSAVQGLTDKLGNRVTRCLGIGIAQ